MKISSLQNPTIKYVAKLKRRKYRNKTGDFIVEGFYPIAFALQNGKKIEQLFICPSLFSPKFDNKSLVNQVKSKGTKVYTVSESVFAKIGCADNPTGLLAVAKQTYKTLPSHKVAETGLYVAIESIEQPHNLGAIIRLADNVGVSGVLICNMRADLYDPQTIRSSFGTVFCVEILQCTTNEAIKWCKENNIQSLATSPSAAINYANVNMLPPTIVVLGAEHGGLKGTWLKHATHKVKIPMAGRANSLSVSASAAVVLYEALRQRSNAKDLSKLQPKP